MTNKMQRFKKSKVKVIKKKVFLRFLHVLWITKKLFKIFQTETYIGKKFSIGPSYKSKGLKKY